MFHAECCRNKYFMFFLLAIGPFELVLNASNLVGPLVTDIVTVWVDYRLTDVVTAPDLLFVVPGTVVTFNVTMAYGSRYVVNFDWDDGNMTQVHVALL